MYQECMCILCAVASCANRVFESVDLSNDKVGSAGHRAVCPLVPGYDNVLGWRSGDLRTVFLERKSQGKKRRCSSVSSRVLGTEPGDGGAHL